MTFQCNHSDSKKDGFRNGRQRYRCNVCGRYWTSGCSSDEPEVRFWMQVKSSRDGCWEWKARLVNGYGQMRINGKLYSAHRLSWLYHYGPPGHLFVCHKCDNPPCVRPDHLFLGTHLDNMRDAIAKNRIPKLLRPLGPYNIGEQNPRSRITENDVREIRRLRASGETCVALAARFGLASSTITDIVKRKRWACVE